MDLIKDKLVESPICDSNACYESEFTTVNGPLKTWLCMTSGFTSNTAMTLDGDSLKETLEYTAELIKDLRQDHEPPGGGEVLAWFPTVVNLPEKGMIFPEGRSIDDWHWKVVKAIPVLEEEKEKFPIPGAKGEYYKFKMDMKNPLVFDKMNFMDAAEAAGMFG